MLGERRGRQARPRLSPLGPAAQELVSGLLSVAPAALALRGSDLAALPRRGAHLDRQLRARRARAKEHERCGSHLIGPLLATTAIGNTLAARAPAHLRSAGRACGAQFGALAASTEIFGWMVRNPEKPLARALAKPGHELQHRLATAEPTPEQIEVAEAALAACLELETLMAVETADARPSPAGDLRSAGREDARRLLHRRVLQPRARDAACTTVAIRAS